MSLNRQVSISEVVSAIAKHRGKVALTFLLVMGLVALAFMLWPRQFGSEGRLFVQLGRTGTGLDPTAGSPSVSIQDSRETEIRSVAELVGSRAVITPVVESIGAERILEHPFSRLFSFSSWLPALSISGDQDTEGLPKDEFKRLKRFEQACQQLERSLSVSAEKKTSVISVYCRAASPQLAQKLVEEIMQQTQARHLEVHSVKGSTEFFDDNFRQKQRDLVDAEKQLARFRNRHGFLSISGAIGTQQKIIDKLAIDLIDAEVNLAQAETRLDDIQSQMELIKPTVSIPKSGVEKLSTEDSRTELFKLESELKRLEETYNSRHPRLAPLKQSVAALRNELNQMPGDRTESAVQINPVFEKVKVSLVDALAESTSLRSRLHHLREKHSEAVARLTELNEHEIEAGQLNRNVNISRQEMELYLQKRSESAVIDELDRKRISDVVVAQDATFVVRHHSPRGSLIFPLGALLAGICATGTALYIERDLLSGHLSEEQVEQILEVPILVSLPRVASHRNMVS